MLLMLLSPAKTLDYTTALKAPVLRRATEPRFSAQAAQLIKRLRPLTPAQVAGLMDLSDELAALNVGRYAAWQPQATPANSRPALLAFDGDVYDGLDARSLTTAQLDWAQRHLAILSGLYGLLRPLDRLQPYRLEMGTRLANPVGADLYAFWRDTVAQAINQQLADERAPVIVNLASQEYARAVDRAQLRPPVVECVFEDWHAASGSFRVLGFFAKRARGRMARWVIEHKLASARRLVEFDVDGYAHDRLASSPGRMVFRRRERPAAEAAESPA